VNYSSIDTQSELQGLVDYAIANGHGPYVPYPLDDPQVATLLPVVVEPYGGGGCIDLRNVIVCLFDPVSPVGVNTAIILPPNQLDLIDPVPVWGCIFPPFQVTDSAALCSPAVLVA
jgi:hypothetical protein